MANRFPIILDTDAGELKEIPAGDVLDLTANTITGLTGLSVTGTIEATSFTSNGQSILEQVQYNDLINPPNIPSDVSDLSDESNRIPADIADLTDNGNLLQAASAFTDLSDTPDDYIGRAGQILKVNSEETGFLFADSGSEISREAVIDALGYTPYNDTNPENYIQSQDVTSELIGNALGYTPYDGDTNPAGYLQGITSTLITDALGYTPYNGNTNPNGYFTSAAEVTNAYGYTPYNGVLNSSNFINDANGVTTALGYTPYDGDTNPLNFLAAGQLTATDINDALGYTAYDGDTNPNNYIFDANGISTALGFTPYDDTNPDGFITGITDADVLTALGYTPYNSTNPDGFISTTTEINDLYGYVPYDGVTNSQGFLQTESDTLDTVTARGATTTASITVSGLSAGAGQISTTGNITSGNLTTGSITTGTTSVIDGDTAGDTIRLGGTAALTLGSSGNIVVQSSIIGNDAFKGLGTSATPFGTAYITDGTIGGMRLNADTIANSDGGITVTISATNRMRVSAGALTLPVNTPTQKGNITSPQSGDTVYVNDGASQYAQTYSAGETAWKTITGPRYVVDAVNGAPTFNGAYYGEMIVFENVDGDHTVFIWVFNSASGAEGADEWVALWETPA